MCASPCLTLLPPLHREQCALHVKNSARNLRYRLKSCSSSTFVCHNGDLQANLARSVRNSSARIEFLVGTPLLGAAAAAGAGDIEILTPFLILLPVFGFPAF